MSKEDILWSEASALQYKYVDLKKGCLYINKVGLVVIVVVVVVESDTDLNCIEVQVESDSQLIGVIRNNSSP